MSELLLEPVHAHVATTKTFQPSILRLATASYYPLKRFKQGRFQ